MAGLNTGQLISSAGIGAAARRKHEATLQDIHDTQLDLEARNRRVDPELRQQRMDRVKVGLDVIDTEDKMEPAEVPEGEQPKAGLTPPSTTTTTATGRKVAATTTPKKGGLKTGDGAEGSTKKGKVTPLPDFMSIVGDERGEYVPPENISPDEDKSGAQKYVERGAHKIGAGESMRVTNEFIEKVHPQTGVVADFFTDPAKFRAMGHKTASEGREFIRTVRTQESRSAIADWFGRHPSAAARFEQASDSDKVQTLKHILDKAGITNVDPDSGLPEKVETQAKETAEQVKEAKKKAGLPASSAIEEKKPSKKRTNILLEGDRGAPRDEALDIKNQYEDLAQRLREEIWVGDDASAENTKAIRKEMAVLKEAYNHALGVQGLQDFNSYGDPRMMQGIMAKKHGVETYIQERGDGTYNIVARDKESGELVPVHEGVSKEEITSSYKSLTDRSYQKAFQDIIAKRAEMQMEFDFDSALEILKGKIGMKRDQAKAFLDAQQARASGEDVQLFNGKIDGDDQLIIREGNKYFKVIPGEKTKAGMTPPAMVEIDPPF